MGRIVLTEAGSAQLLKQALGVEKPEPLLLKLYVNPHRPDGLDDAAVYVELDGHGYQPKRIVPGDWALHRLERGPAALEAGPVVWVFGDGDPIQVYGSYAVGARRGLLYWGDALEGGPVLLQHRGDRVEIWPTVASVIVPAAP